MKALLLLSSWLFENLKLLVNSDPVLLLPLPCPGVWALIVHLGMQCFLRNFPLHLLGLNICQHWVHLRHQQLSFCLRSFLPFYPLSSPFKVFVPVSTGPSGAALLGFSVGVNKYAGNLLDTKQYTFSIALEKMWLFAVSQESCKIRPTQKPSVTASCLPIHRKNCATLRTASRLLSLFYTVEGSHIFMRFNRANCQYWRNSGPVTWHVARYCNST